MFEGSYHAADWQVHGQVVVLKPGLHLFSTEGTLHKTIRVNVAPHGLICSLYQYLQAVGMLQQQADQGTV